MTDYDGIYHQIFGSPVMVAELLREFATGPWLDDHDLDRMTRLNTTFHSAAGKKRNADVVWQIPRHSGGDTYLLLLVEFQSKTDPWMALRALVYVGLLWQHLIAEKRLLPNDRLPPVLPIVLHRGRARWAAPLVLRELVGLQDGSPLWHFQPDMRYHVIDEGSFSEADLQPRKGLIALLFRLENTRDPERLPLVLDALVEEIAHDPGLEALWPPFQKLLAAAIQNANPSISVPDNLSEMQNMLTSSDVQSWKQQAFQQGEVALLLRLLERRFGPTPLWVKERISTASVETLEEWGIKVLDATNFEQIFE